jgi:hypothetical protein
MEDLMSVHPFVPLARGGFRLLSSKRKWRGFKGGKAQQLRQLNLQHRFGVSENNFIHNQ